MIGFCNYGVTLGVKGQEVLAAILTDLRPAETVGTAISLIKKEQSPNEATQ